MNWPVLLGIAAVNFTSALLQASTGFGYALVAMSFMPLFLPMSTCSAISAVSVVAIGLQMSLKLRRHLELRRIALPLLCCLLTVNLGLWILDTCDELVLRILLAALLLAVTALFFWTRRRQIALPDKWYAAAAAGLITGISTGMFNIVGPFLMVYFLSVCDSTLSMKADLEFCFLISGLYSACMHLFVYHNIRRPVLPEITVSVLAVLLAGFLGLRLYRRIHREKIALVVYILLPVMAVTLIWNGLS